MNQPESAAAPRTPRSPAFLAALPERPLRTLSELSGACELRAGGVSARHGVRSAALV